MARITVEDCLDNVENRFELVMVATKRARQLATGGKDPMVKEDSDKATVIALREIAEGLVTPKTLEKVDFDDEDEGSSDFDLDALAKEIESDLNQMVDDSQAATEVEPEEEQDEE